MDSCLRRNDGMLRGNDGLAARPPGMPLRACCARTRPLSRERKGTGWIPACAGMTDGVRRNDGGRGSPKKGEGLVWGPVVDFG